MDLTWLLTDSFMYMRLDTNLSLVSIFTEYKTSLECVQKSQTRACYMEKEGMGLKESWRKVQTDSNTITALFTENRPFLAELSLSLFIKALQLEVLIYHKNFFYLNIIHDIIFSFNFVPMSPVGTNQQVTLPTYS